MLINQKISQYIDTLTDQYLGIKSIWLIGSRANDSYRDDSDWDLFAFADQHIFDKLKGSRPYTRDKIDLLVVFDGEHFEEPWPDEKGAKEGTLTTWEWNEISPKEARYKSVKYKRAEKFKSNIDCKILKAFKLWP